jgi:hypothetical protein
VGFANYDAANVFVISSGYRLVRGLRQAYAALCDEKTLCLLITELCSLIHWENVQEPPSRSPSGCYAPLPPPIQRACYIPHQLSSNSTHKTTITFSGVKLFGVVDTDQVELSLIRSTTAGSVRSIEHLQHRYP